MASYLYRLGRFSYQRRRVMAVVWAVLLTALAVAALTLHGKTVNAFSIPGTESQRALDSLHTDFPAAAGASATIVVKAPAGSTLVAPAMKSAVEATVAEAKALPQVGGVVDPYSSKAISRDGRTGLISVQYAVGAQSLSTAATSAFDAVGATGRAAGLTVAPDGSLTGGAPQIGITEVIGVVVAGVVLVVSFGSLIAAGMTLLTALIGVLAGMSGLFLLTSVIDVSSTAPILALMLGLAVGIDYALFISSRHRTQLAQGMELEESVARATATAGSAVLFAGATVVIALAAMSLVGVPFLTAMGFAAAGTVLTAILVALTLLPAVLGFVGTRILPRSLRKQSGDLAVPTGAGRGGRHRPDRVATAGVAGGRSLPGDEVGFGFRWARLVIRFRIPIVIVGVLGLGALAIPVQDLRLALPDSGTAAPGTNARIAYDLTSEGFGPGFNGPLVVVVKAPTAAAATSLTAQVAALSQKLPDIVAVAPGAANQAGTTRLVTVIPSSGPTSKATAALVGSVRDAVRPLDSGSASVSVTGVTAIGVDVSDKLTAALPRYLLVVIGLSFLLLLIAFRSILVPLKATLGFLLTIGATFGLTVAVFQWGWASSLFGVSSAGPLVSFLPVIMIGCLFGLAMDYEVFIVSRVREEFVHGSHATVATIQGVGHGARVVTAAALIMSAVFGGFILVDDPIIKSIGFGLALGVLIDAFIVRMTLVPAVLALLGDRAWSIPRWLNRVIPNVDIEGADLGTGGSGTPIPHPVVATA